MITPKSAAHVLANVVPLAGTLLPFVVLWFAGASLGWCAPGLGLAGIDGCQMLGTAQLFGGLLMLSSCSRAAGALWTALVFSATAVAAVVGLHAFGAALAFALTVWCALDFERSVRRIRS